MNLIEIDGITMECGAPLPLIFADEHQVRVVFLKLNEGDSVSDNEPDNVDIYVLTFDRCLKHRFGFPNDEALYGHPYYELGMRWYAFYELRDSDWFAELVKIEEKSFPHFDVEKSWPMYKHYIITFHDSMFECIAKGYTIEEKSIASIVYKKLGKIDI